MSASRPPRDDNYEGLRKAQLKLRPFKTLIRKTNLAMFPLLCFHRCGLGVAAGAAIGLQDFLAEAQALRRDLAQLVVGNELDCLLKVEVLEGHQADSFIGG